MSKYEKKLVNGRKPHDMRVVTSIKGPVGQILGLKTKAIWEFLKCCIEGCNNPTKTRGAALCAEHKQAMRRVQFGLASTRLRDSKKHKPAPRILSRFGGRPSYRALMDPKWAMKLASAKKNQTGPLATAEGREALKRGLEDKGALFTALKVSSKAVKRHAKRVQAKVNADKVDARRKKKARAA